MTTYHINKITHITETEKKGFWLWDENRGMNLSMRADSKELALIEALEYYQKRLPEIEQKLNRLQSKVNTFIGSLGIDLDEIDLDDI